MTVYNVIFNDRLFTRKSERDYTHAAFNMNRPGAWVSFHGSESAARKAAGSFGQVKPVNVSVHNSTRVPSSGVCIVCHNERYITNRHADGRVTRDRCYRCNVVNG
jgi:hypothetical protein